MEMTIRNFGTVCEALKNGLEMYDRTEKVYNFLKAHKGEEFSPKEIAKGIGFCRKSFCSDTEFIYHEQVVHPLHWLLQMGLVGKTEHKEIITIENPYPTRVKDVKIINGVEYVGYVYKDTIEVTSKSYTWFVK